MGNHGGAGRFQNMEKPQTKKLSLLTYIMKTVCRNSLTIYSAIVHVKAAYGLTV